MRCSFRIHSLFAERPAPPYYEGMKDNPTYVALRNAGLRRTPVRIGVLDQLAQGNKPVSVSEILGHMPDHTDAVTVYRTLNTFIKKKLIHRIVGEDREWRYALGGRMQKKQHQHPHFVCEDCGTVECLISSAVPKNLIDRLKIAANYTVTYSEVVLHGLCPKCAPAGHG